MLDIDPVRYCLAVISEGLGETQVKLLAKLIIESPSAYVFYQAQKKKKKLIELVEKYTSNFLSYIYSNLPADCSRSARRNAEHAIVVFMDIRTKLFFDFIIVSRNPSISDIEFHGPSNMMEKVAVQYVRNKYINNYKSVGFVHDFDVDTAPAFHPDSETGQLIEYLDPGHLKKELENVNILNAKKQFGQE